MRAEGIEVHEQTVAQSVEWSSDGVLVLANGQLFRGSPLPPENPKHRQS